MKINEDVFSPPKPHIYWAGRTGWPECRGQVARLRRSTTLRRRFWAITVLARVGGDLLARPARRATMKENPDAS